MEDENVSGQTQWTAAQYIIHWASSFHSSHVSSADDPERGRPSTSNEQHIHDYHKQPFGKRPSHDTRKLLLKLINC
jgi:hypothetical protein